MRTCTANTSTNLLCVARPCPPPSPLHLPRSFPTALANLPLPLPRRYFDKGLAPKPAVPNAAAKEKMREAVFGLLDKSQTEEMQLLLEYEKKREEEGAFRAEYLAEGLYTTQKENYRELKEMIVDYQVRRVHVSRCVYIFLLLSVCVCVCVCVCV